MSSDRQQKRRAEIGAPTTCKAERPADYSGSSSSAIASSVSVKSPNPIWRDRLPSSHCFSSLAASLRITSAIFCSVVVSVFGISVSLKKAAAFRALRGVVETAAENAQRNAADVLSVMQSRRPDANSARPACQLDSFRDERLTAMGLEPRLEGP